MVEPVGVHMRAWPAVGVAEAAYNWEGVALYSKAGVSPKIQVGYLVEHLTGYLAVEHWEWEATVAEVGEAEADTVGCRYSSLRPTNYFRLRLRFAALDRRRLGKISFSTREI